MTPSVLVVLQAFDGLRMPSCREHRALRSRHLQLQPSVKSVLALSQDHLTLRLTLHSNPAVKLVPRSPCGYKGMPGLAAICAFNRQAVAAFGSCAHITGNFSCASSVFTASDHGGTRAVVLRREQSGQTVIGDAYRP